MKARHALYRVDKVSDNHGFLHHRIAKLNRELVKDGQDESITLELTELGQLVADESRRSIFIQTSCLRIQDRKRLAKFHQEIVVEYGKTMDSAWTLGRRESPC